MYLSSYECDIVNLVNIIVFLILLDFYENI